MGSYLAEQVLLTAAYEVGVVESGGNDLGPRIQEYQASVNLPPGTPWCAAFVHWCLKQRNIAVEPATGDTWEIRSWALDHKILDSIPQRGDIFLLLGSDGMPMHTGFVCGSNDDGTFRSIEGNTYLPNSDVKGVARKVRLISECVFVHWVQLKGDET